jgi:hypothetical protein
MYEELPPLYGGKDFYYPKLYQGSSYYDIALKEVQPSLLPNTGHGLYQYSLYANGIGQVLEEAIQISHRPALHLVAPSL